jgi:hypothetical protein
MAGDDVPQGDYRDRDEYRSRDEEQRQQPGLDIADIRSGKADLEKRTANEQ